MCSPTPGPLSSEKQPVVSSLTISTGTKLKAWRSAAWRAAASTSPSEKGPNVSQHNTVTVESACSSERGSTHGESVWQDAAAYCISEWEEMPVSEASGGSDITSVCSATLFVALDWTFLHALLKMRGLLLRGESNPVGSVSMSKILDLTLGLLLMAGSFFSPSWDKKKASLC